MRTPRIVESAQASELVLDGRRVICMCSNNYLGLANHPQIAQAAREAATAYGFGACAARHITGSSSCHVRAERAIADFMGQPKALLFSTGYSANVGSVQALSTRDTLVLSDELNHASLIDGCRLGRGQVRIYRHGDVEHAAALLRDERHHYRAALVLTESVFSMDGDQAPLVALRDLTHRHRAALIVDEAHALGVVGSSGRGLCAQLGVSADLVTGTFGKAFGASGAFATGPAPVVRWIENCARSYLFSTAPSPVVAAAAVVAIALVEAAEQGRTRLSENAARLRAGLRELAYPVPEGDGHIIPVVLGAASAATRVSAHLLEHGVFVHGIRPPTVPAGTSRLRLTPMATHSPDHIATTLTAFRALRPTLAGAP